MSISGWASPKGTANNRVDREDRPVIWSLERTIGCLLTLSRYHFFQPVGKKKRLYRAPLVVHKKTPFWNRMWSRYPKQLAIGLASLRWFTCTLKNLGLVKIIIICYRRFLKNVNLKHLNINMMSRVTIVATMLDRWKVFSSCLCFSPSKLFISAQRQRLRSKVFDHFWWPNVFLKLKNTWGRN